MNRSSGQLLTSVTVRTEIGHIIGNHNVTYNVVYINYYLGKGEPRGMELNMGNRALHKKHPGFMIRIMRVIVSPVV